MEQNQEAFDVFLSHNADDKPTVIELARCLKDRGLSTWLDVWELRPGYSWVEGLEKGLSSCKSCAALIGKTGFGPWQKKEIQAALVTRGPEFPVIPVLLTGAPDRAEIGPFLSLMTWVDLRNGVDDSAGIDRLIWGITGLRPDQGSELVSPSHTSEISRLNSNRYAIHDPKNGDLLIGPSRITGSGPANDWVFLHYRSPETPAFELGAQSKTNDKGDWETIFPATDSLRPGPYELYAAGPLSRFASQRVTVYYRDNEAVRRPCAMLTEKTDDIEIAYELHTAFIEATKLHKRNLIFSGKVTGRARDLERIASRAGDAIAARLTETVPKGQLLVTGSIDADDCLRLDPDGAWASYYAFPVPKDRTGPVYGFSPDARAPVGVSMGQTAWQLTPHVDRIPANPFGDRYGRTSEYLEIRYDGYRPEFVSLEESRSRSFEVRLVPVIHKRIAVLDFPSVDSSVALGTFSQVIAREMVDAIQRRPELASLWSRSDAQAINEVLNLVDVRGVEQQLESVDTEMISGEGRHLKRKILDVNYVVRGSYRIVAHRSE